ncbi:MAG: glycosyltransferase [Pseudomonadota bacterium]
MKSGRVFLYVQHLLGIGHLARAAALARALLERGLEVTLASGGAPVPERMPAGARIVQLAPASAADLTFRTLLDASGRPVDEAWKAARREALLAAWREARADVLLTELFPFGRRQMRFELLPLLEAARASRPRPVIAASVRDIVGAGQKDPARQDEMLELFERYYDHALVHSDPRVVGFERSFRHAARLGARLHYTGFIAAPPAPPAPDAAGEVLVSAGGGAVGARLLEAAIRARRLTALAGRIWRVLGGANLPQSTFDSLAALARAEGGDGIVLERFRADFPSRLAACALSVSQAGYNTLMEALAAGARAVVVPFAGGGETEQRLRARLFSERGLIEALDEDELAPESLAAAIARALARPAPRSDAVNLDGARTSAALIAGWAGR